MTAADGRVDRPEVDERFGALDLVPEAVVLVDRDGIVVHHNDRAAGLLGLRSARGRPFDDVVVLTTPEGSPVAWPDLRAADAGPGTRMVERLLVVRLGYGRRRQVTVAGRFDDPVALTFRSAGRRGRLERAQADVIATVSHEIRSPLTSIKGFTQTLLRRWDRFGDEQKRTMLATIEHDADRVTRLLTELLEVSRIDAGRVQLHPRPVDVLALVESVADKARHRPEGTDRSILVHVSGEPPRITADPDKLEQVLTNLIDNALQYAPGSPVRVHVRAEAAGIGLAVADDGPGVPADQRSRIFTKFGRGRGARRAGTGLGLYIARGLVLAHGGRMWLDDDLGDGATFHLWLPSGQS